MIHWSMWRTIICPLAGLVAVATEVIAASIRLKFSVTKIRDAITTLVECAHQISSLQGIGFASQDVGLIVLLLIWQSNA